MIPYLLLMQGEFFFQQIWSVPLLFFLPGLLCLLLCLLFALRLAATVPQKP